MAGSETYGGCCPQCLKGMVQKFESSWSGFMLEACPHCGFIYAEGGNALEMNKDEAWQSIFEHYDVKGRKEILAKYTDLDYVSPEESEHYPSIFDYTEDEGTLLMYRMLHKQYGTIDRNYQVKGQRVFWYEDKGHEGTLMSCEDGKVYILWDKHKGSKLPYTQYPAVEMGKTILLVEALDKPPVVDEEDWVNEEVFKALNYLQHKKGIDVREIRESFMNADRELFVATNSDDMNRLRRAREAIAKIVDNIRSMLKFYQ